MASLTFAYHTDANYYRTFSILRLRGLEYPDECEFVPGLQFVAPDGTIIESIVGFRRIITVDIGVLNESADRAFVLNFLANRQRWVTLSTTGTIDEIVEILTEDGDNITTEAGDLLIDESGSGVVLADPAGFENNWKMGSQYQRYYGIRLRENTIHTEWE